MRAMTTPAPGARAARKAALGARLWALGTVAVISVSYLAGCAPRGSTRGLTSHGGTGGASAGDASGSVGGLATRRPPPAAPSVARIIATDSLAALLARGPALVVDVRTDVGLYLRAHLPGAVYLNTEALRASAGGVPNLALPAESYRSLLGRLGVRVDRPVVVYSSGEARNIDATFLAWILAGFGHPAAYVLDGGYAKWEAEGRPTTRAYPQVDTTPLAAPAFALERATLAQVRASLGRGTGDATLLVDARVPEQYAGEAGAQMRRGHIPGAVNHYWADDLSAGGFGRVWKDRETLRSSYAAQGITPDRDIVVYCNGGLESSHVYFTLRSLLGYPRVRVYDGSWTEWAAHEELPMETGAGKSGSP